jgi:hypothetical protein
MSSTCRLFDERDLAAEVVEHFTDSRHAKHKILVDILDAQFGYREVPHAIIPEAKAILCCRVLGLTKTDDDAHHPGNCTRKVSFCPRSDYPCRFDTGCCGSGVGVPLQEVIDLCDQIFDFYHVGQDRASGPLVRSSWASRMIHSED